MLIKSDEVNKNMEVMTMIEGLVSDTIANTMLEPDECWQPTDFLPNMQDENAIEQVISLRKRCEAIPDSVITSLVGNMITEEALPSYQTYFNILVNEEGSLTSDNS